MSRITQCHWQADTTKQATITKCLALASPCTVTYNSLGRPRPPLSLSSLPSTHSLLHKVTHRLLPSAEPAEGSSLPLPSTPPWGPQRLKPAEGSSRALQSTAAHSSEGLKPPEGLKLTEGSSRALPSILACNPTAPTSP